MSSRYSGCLGEISRSSVNSAGSTRRGKSIIGRKSWRPSNKICLTVGCPPRRSARCSKLARKTPEKVSAAILLAMFDARLILASPDTPRWRWTRKTAASPNSRHLQAPSEVSISDNTSGSSSLFAASSSDRTEDDPDAARRGVNSSVATLLRNRESGSGSGVARQLRVDSFSPGSLSLASGSLRKPRKNRGTLGSSRDLLNGVNSAVAFPQPKTRSLNGIRTGDTLVNSPTAFSRRVYPSGEPR
jgi:hypothetical protein